MSLVYTFLYGFGVLSDLGTNASIIQNPRGDHPDFLRTGWTVEIFRGILLFMLASLLAGPMASFYEQPTEQVQPATEVNRIDSDLQDPAASNLTQNLSPPELPSLRALLMVASLSLLISGFRSTNYHILTRRVAIAKLTSIELSAQTIGIVSTIIGVYFFRSVWALVIGGLVQPSVVVVLSHIVIEGPRMKFAFKRNVVWELVHFGKWIFVNGLLTFCVAKMDRLVLPKLIGFHLLGVYHFAAMLAQIMFEVVTRLCHRILFPIYSRTAEIGMQELRKETFRIRSSLMLITLPPVTILIVWGPEIMKILYDNRYQEGGWMLQVLGLSTLFSCILVPVGIVLLAVGNSFKYMLLQLVRSILLVATMLIGYYFYELHGIIWGMALASLLYYPFLVLLVKPYKAWMPRLDLVGIIASAALIGIGFAVKPTITPPLMDFAMQAKLTAKVLVKGLLN